MAFLWQPETAAFAQVAELPPGQKPLPRSEWRGLPRINTYLESQNWSDVRYDRWPDGLGPEPEHIPALYEQLVSSHPTCEQTGLAATRYCPSGLTLCVTLRCNFSCEYCNLRAVPPRYRTDMSVDTAKAAVNFLINTPWEYPLSLTFFGGEPLLCEKLIRQTIQFAEDSAAKRNRKITFAITTNASLLTGDIVDLFIEKNVVPVLSFDGIFEFQRYRLGNSRSRCEDLLEKIESISRRMNGNVHFRVTVVPGPRELIADNLDFLFSLGAYQYSFTAAHDYVTDRATGPLAAAWRWENIDILRFCSDCLTDKWVKLMASGRRVIVNPILTLSSEVLDPGFPLIGCGACRGSYSVRPDGALFCCYTFFDNNDYRIGDVFTGFDQKALMGERRKFFWDSPVCGKCPMRYNCAGGCFNDMARVGEHNVERFPVMSCIGRAENLKRAAYLVKHAPPKFIEWISKRTPKDGEGESEQTERQKRSRTKKTEESK